MRALSITLISVVAAAVASGCVIEVATFDPVGGDSTLDGEWTVNGGVADVASCDAAGIAFVEVRLYQESGDGEYVYGTFDCADGFFDARDDLSLPGLFADRYLYRWFALDGAGVALGQSDPMTVDLTVALHATLTSIDWTTDSVPVFEPFGGDVSLEGAWQIDGKVPTDVDCLAAGVDTVQLVIQSADGTAEATDPSLTFACAQASFDTRPAAILAAGSYQTVWRAFDAAGALLAETPALGLDVTAVDHATLATADFIGLAPPFDPSGGDITLSGDWQVDDKVPTDVDCDIAGIAQIAVIVYSADGTEEWTDPSLTFACADASFDTTPTAALAAGDYQIALRALAADGTTHSESLAEAVSAPSPGHVTLATAFFTTTAP